MGSDAVDWSTKENTEVHVGGIAQNAKAGAVLMTGPEDAILIPGLAEWDSTTVGKRVLVDAVVRRMRGFPKSKGTTGVPMQGTASGRDTWVLELNSYRVLD